MNNVFVKPRLIGTSPAIVRDPVTKNPLAAGGEWKTRNQFWTRRIRDGDVIDATEAQLAVQQKPAAAAPVYPAPDEPERPFDPGPSRTVPDPALGVALGKTKN